jgi:hypothetical protein
VLSGVVGVVLNFAKFDRNHLEFFWVVRHCAGLSVFWLD